MLHQTLDVSDRFRQLSGRITVRSPQTSSVCPADARSSGKHNMFVREEAPMLTARYVGDRVVETAEATPEAPGRRPGAGARRVHRPVRHRSAHPARLDGRPRDAPARSSATRPAARSPRRRRRDRVGGRRPRRRHAARLGRHLPGVPRGPPAHLPEPDLHRHRLPRRLQELWNVPAAHPRAAARRAATRPRRARRAGRGRRARRATLRTGRRATRPS